MGSLQLLTLILIKQKLKKYKIKLNKELKEINEKKEKNN